ncbi:MAG: hypothetical protein ACREFJ_01165 [Acetobacteraceae bacterium]
MRFVVKPRSGDAPTTVRYPHAVPVQDNWDDYLFTRMFVFVRLVLPGTDRGG